jgi:hypothetical protein
LLRRSTSDPLEKPSPGTNVSAKVGKMKKLSAGLLVAAVLLAGNAFASELTLKTTEKYYSILNLKNSMRQMIDLMGNQVLANMQYYTAQDMKKRGMADDEIKAVMAVIKTNVMDIKNVTLSNLDQLLPVKQIIPEIYYPVLKKHFSEEEVQQLIKFYQSPLGKKTIKEMPVIMSESSRMLNQSSKYVPNIQKFFSGELDKRKEVMRKEMEKEIEKARKESEKQKEKQQGSKAK